MKRRRDHMEKGSELKSAVDELSLVKLKPAGNSDAAHIPTRPFLHVCSLVIQVLDKIGPTMAVLRQDIDQNIQRLEVLCDSDSSIYANMVEILKKEMVEGNTRKGNSCSKAIVWLTRSLDFTVALLERMVKDPVQSMEQAVEEAYNMTLKPWHGWISSAAFRVGLKLVPDCKTFLSLLMSKEEHCATLNDDMQTFISLLMPILEEIHSAMRSYGLDRLKST
ncbi:hypothetical protein K2173_022954 [Erythroxylum novogranatense]|uniref:Glycolipid transfer protein domain-containing protein n=1 Tax=Erythroxylum novogranatense TaxID=1862640 RepID=A0AAV8T9E4_9ROSI|nr:hypothetical protein K2173_022954 [Erythroxylum novogranatense]